MHGSEYNPGSLEAVGKGCTCDPELNRLSEGTPIRGELIFYPETGYPLHGAAVALDAIYNSETEVVDLPV